MVCDDLDRMFVPRSVAVVGAKQMEKELLDAGIPVYRSFEYAAAALARFSDYHLYYRLQDEMNGDFMKGEEMKLAS